MMVRNIGKSIAVAATATAFLFGPAQAGAQQSNGACPYDMRDSGMSDEQIREICLEWEKSFPPTGPRTGDGEQFPGQNCQARCDANVK